MQFRCTQDSWIGPRSVPRTVEARNRLRNQWLSFPFRCQHQARVPAFVQKVRIAAGRLAPVGICGEDPGGLVRARRSAADKRLHGRRGSIGHFRTCNPEAMMRARCSWSKRYPVQGLNLYHGTSERLKSATGQPVQKSSAGSTDVNLKVSIGIGLRCCALVINGV